MEKVRLIDANALVDKLPKVDLDHDERITKSGAVADMVCLISNAPTIEAEPVRHGRWIEYTFWIGSFGQIYTRCSVCETKYPGRKGGRGDGRGGKYCEECGAKMDLEG